MRKVFVGETSKTDPNRNYMSELSDIKDIAKARRSKLEKLQEAKEKLLEYQLEFSRLHAEMSGYKAFLGLPTETNGLLSSDQKKELITMALTHFLDGANGRELADALCVYGINSDTLSKTAT